MVNPLEAFLGFGGVTLGTGADYSAPEGPDTQHLLNDAAQAVATGLNLISVLPGPTPLNFAAVTADAAAFIANSIVLYNDINSPPGPNSGFEFLVDVGTELGDALSFIGATGLLLGSLPSNLLKFTGNVLTAQGIAVDAIIIAKNVTKSVTDNYRNSALRTITSSQAQLARYSLGLSPYIGASGNAVIDDFGTSLSYASLAMNDYGTDNFSSDVSNETTSIVALQTAVVNLFSSSGASSQGALTISGTAPSVAFSNSTNSISASITNANDFGAGQSISLSDGSGSTLVNVLGVATLTNGEVASSLHEVSTTSSASQNVVLDGGGVESPFAQLGGISVTTTPSQPYFIGYDAAGETSVTFPFSGPISSVSVIQTSGGAYDVEEGDPQQIVDFAPDGIVGDTINISQDSSATVDVTLDIGAGDTAAIDSENSVNGVAQNLAFMSNDGTLVLEDPWSFSGTIYGAVTGDFVELVGVTTAPITQFASKTDPTFKVENTKTGQTATIQFAPADIENYSTAGFEVGDLLGNGSLTFEIFRNTACFAAGTRISTQRGDIAVEELAVGDLVEAHFAGQAPIRWIGHRRVDCSRHPDPRRVWPVRIAAGAFGSAKPARDLWLSPDHAIFSDGVLIPIKHLVNGTTIEQVQMAQVTYYHIELSHHDVLIAEGLPAESYLDTGDRSNFANGGALAKFHSDFAERAREAEACAPLVVAGPKVEAARASVGALAAAINDGDALNHGRPGQRAA